MKVERLQTKARAWVAAASHGLPARRMRVIVVSGADGADATALFLASILKAAGERVGVIARDFVEIAGKHATGSDRAHPLQEASHLHELLAQMRKAKCSYVIIEQSDVSPAHEFVGVPLYMVVVRRCGDSFLPPATLTARKAQAQALLGRNPKFVVLPRDDICFDDLHQPDRATAMTYGVHPKAECQLREVQLHPKGSAAEALIDHQTTIAFTTLLAGKQAIYSALAAVAAAYLLHLPIDAIEDGVADMHVPRAHLQPLPLVRPYRLVFERSYTPEGMSETLEALKHFAKNRLIVVAAPVADQSPAWLSSIGEIVGKHADRIVLTGGEHTAAQDPRELGDRLLNGIGLRGGEAKTELIPDRRQAIEKALSIARRGDTIVLCPSLVRPYRQVGKERQHWNDETVVRELLEG